jgi:hypothetical protein
VIRKLLTTVLLLVATLGLTAQVPAHASVTPTSGNYQNSYRDEYYITFTFTGPSHVTNFRVNDHLVGAAHVVHGAWSETCHGHYCIKGHWTDAGTVSVAWRFMHHTHWHHFVARRI